MSILDIFKKKQKTIYCFVGESGCGKSTLADMITKEEGIPQVLSWTSRKPRYSGEKGYIFSDKGTYKQHKEEGKIFEETFFADNYYWTLKESFDIDDTMIFICNPVGVQHVKEKFAKDKIVVIYFKTDVAIRYNRMVERSRKETIEEKKEEALIRLEKDKKSFQFIECDYVIDNNGDVYKSLIRIYDIMNSIA